MSETPLALIRAHLNLDHEADDELLGHYAGAAESWIASYIGTRFDPAEPRMIQAVLLLVGHSYIMREAASFARPFSIPYGIEDQLSGLKTRITGHTPEPEPEVTP
ncbi:MAG TPA: phage gp6-like head-tail connector protein [Paracoccus solventivorans]|uniref:Phage gp6-like head-tail connector protein n=1 Tax=Paracoccus solventivorans TaxID=53463 RepID=A0A832QYI0_9RHOB|nr:head-tail connector protein [Paracoccus solventivorans]HHW34338.1 phage gp6-like head-tail connector protein [Paracoccus solventivorans]